jgi:hypothetical protein
MKYFAGNLPQVLISHLKFWRVIEENADESGG